MLSASYTDEQAKLTEALLQRESEIQRLKETVSNTVAFLDKAKRYTDIQELTPELLRLFIQKIVVHENSKTGTAQRDPESILNHSQRYTDGKPGWCLKHQPGIPHRRCYPCQGAANRSPGFSRFRAFAADFPAKRRACRPLAAGSKPL